MAFRVEITTRAVRDLQALYETIHAADSVLAQRWFNGLEKAILSLDVNPERGIAATEKSGVRQLLYPSKSYGYRILYRIHAKQRVVYVLHIRHAARKPL